MKNYFDVVVIGAGAAGLMAASTAGARGRRVLLLDHATKLAEKIRLSGGGKCNFTNLDIKPECFISENPHYCRSALAQFTQHDFIALLAQYGIKWHEKTLGQLFCDESAGQITSMLDQECQKAKVVRKMGVDIESVYSHEERFVIQTSISEFFAGSLVVTTGGLALPEVGATPFGYKIAERFGLRIVPPVAGLVPLALHKEDLEWLAPLSGTSLEVEVHVEGSKQKFRENILFTHKGISGPAVLQISSYWKPGQRLVINLLPEHDVESLLQRVAQGDKKISTLLTECGWPKRFVVVWLAQQKVKDSRVKELSQKNLKSLAESLEKWSIMPNATLGYKFAETTRGGVDTRDLNSKTMMANLIPNLYFAGEVVDVAGWLGGYNLQWAWSSGYVAGMNA